jgi:hypothetical protein
LEKGTIIASSRGIESWTQNTCWGHLPLLSEQRYIRVREIEDIEAVFVFLSREPTTYVFILGLHESREKLAILMIFTSGMSKANGMFRVFASFWQEET